jgi:hypothetical protein
MKHSYFVHNLVQFDYSFFVYYFPSFDEGFPGENEMLAEISLAYLSLDHASVGNNNQNENVMSKMKSNKEQSS